MNILDSNQNQQILDNYLDIKLDFSQVFFLITANNKDKIPVYLLSRIGNNIIELEGYSIDEKKAIAENFIQNYFSLNSTIPTNHLYYLFSPPSIYVHYTIYSNFISK